MPAVKRQISPRPQDPPAPPFSPQEDGMTRHLACSLLTLLTIASAGPGAAHSLPSRPPDVEILVNGVPQARYAHDGRWYVEALKGREYAIRLRNPYPVRVAVALSVDGLNTIDARETTAAGARKWVLGPYETVTISGWQTSASHARAFEFTTEERSYGQALGHTANLGTIAAVFFRERVPEYSRRRDRREPFAEAAPPAASAPQTRRESERAAAGQSANKAAADDYAATGMGRRTEHAVELVWLDLEDTPAASVNIRYEFRPQLVRLGILPAPHAVDPLQRRERARGFEPGFAPEID
jgi:hypothetical protein